MGTRAQSADTRSAGSRLTDELEAFMSRIARKDVPDEVAQRGQALADAIAQVAEEAAQRASNAWRESQPVRKDMSRAFERQGREVG